MYRILEVNNRQTHHDFLDCPRIIYKDDPNWVCLPDSELSGIFNPQKNPFFKHGEATRYVLYDNNKIIGRVGVFINRKKAYTFEQPTGGFGFFESINDLAASKLLFDTAKDWLAARGMQAMDGPINFGENDRNWGLLVEGFSQPFIGMQYHLPYYRNLFEAYGFKPYFEQVSRIMDISKPPPDRFVKIAEWTMNKQHITYRHPNKTDMASFIADFVVIYNDAWQHHPNFTPLTSEQMVKTMKEMKLILIEEMVTFAYVKDEPAGFLVCLPDLNQIFKPLKGKMNIWEGIKFLWRKRNKYQWYRERGILNRGRVIIMGVRPKFQKLGLESGMVITPMDSVRNMGFREIELGWVGDFNPAMQAIQDVAASDIPPKKHVTYRYLFEKQGETQYSARIIR
jgi:hypothetical protein